MAHITERLRDDHRRVQQLFERLRHTTNGAEADRQHLCLLLINELLVRVLFTEDVLYPAVLKGRRDADSIVDAAIRDHEEIGKLLERLDHAELHEDSILDKMAALEETVLDHFAREESELFPLACKTIDEGESQSMARELDRISRNH